MLETATTVLLPIATWVLWASCKAVAIIAAVLICRRWLASKLTPRSAHLLWLAALACLLVPFGMDLNLSWFVQPTEPAHGEAQLGMPEAPRVEADSGPVQSQAAAQPSVPVFDAAGTARVSIASMLAMLWAGVSTVLFAFALLNLFRYRRVKARARDADACLRELLMSCKSQLGLRRDVALRETPRIDSPVVFGWLSPTLLLPVGLQHRLGAIELRHVFLHELAHVQRHDILLNWLATFAQILHWFNPVVWYGLRHMRADMEQACDAKVLSHLSSQEHADYGATLINLMDRVSGRPPAPGLGIVDGRTQIEERITMIATFRSRKIASPLFAAFALLGLTSVALTQPRLDAPEPAQPRPMLDAPASVASVPVPVRVAQAAPAPRSAAPVAPAAPMAPSSPAAPPAPAGEGKSAGDPKSGGVPLEVLIEQVARNIQKRVIVDPSAKGFVTLYGQKISEIDYPQLLTILRIHGFTAYELNGYVNVVPIAQVRSQPVPVVVQGGYYADDQFVNGRIALKNACAMNFVPMLRPLLPQHAHLVADIGSNSILMVDTYANFKRIESTIKELDANSTSKRECEPPPRPATATAAPAAPKS